MSEEMRKRGKFTKALAMGGTVLVWFPLLAPLFFGLIAFMSKGIFRFDYLMPAEFFPVAMTGGALLAWAALRARARLWLIGGGLGMAIVSLIGGQLLAVVTGLASGETEPGGWQWVLVLALIAVYALSVAIIGVGGVLLWRDLFTSSRPRP
jgi:hypothetical protein